LLERLAGMRFSGGVVKEILTVTAWSSRWQVVAGELHIILVPWLLRSTGYRHPPGEWWRGKREVGRSWRDLGHAWLRPPSLSLSFKIFKC
jgi:hypothetical protein